MIMKCIFNEMYILHFCDPSYNWTFNIPRPIYSKWAFRSLSRSSNIPADFFPLAFPFLSNTVVQLVHGAPGGSELARGSGTISEPIVGAVNVMWLMTPSENSIEQTKRNETDQEASEKPYSSAIYALRWKHLGQEAQLQTTQTFHEIHLRAAIYLVIPDGLCFTPDSHQRWFKALWFVVDVVLWTWSKNPSTGRNNSYQ